MNSQLVAAVSTAGIDYGTVFDGMKSEAMSGVNAALPIGLGIGAAIIGVMIGWKLIKRFAK